MAQLRGKGLETRVTFESEELCVEKEGRFRKQKRGNTGCGKFWPFVFRGPKNGRRIFFVFKTVAPCTRALPEVGSFSSGCSSACLAEGSVDGLVCLGGGPTKGKGCGIAGAMRGRSALRGMRVEFRSEREVTSA